MRRAALVAVSSSIALFSSLSYGAGLGRPNVLGARAVGMGGAWAAVADDPTAAWHNPAGLALYGDTSVYLGGELVILGRTYTPFGFGKLAPNRFALAVLAYDVYGGAISFNPSDVQNQGILSTQILDFEVAPTLAYQVTDVLSIGAGVRIGINSFSVNDNEAAFKANLSLLGVGIGGTLGLMVRPHPRVQIGAVYRTSLSSTLSGNGPITVAGSMPSNKDASLSVTWPQSAALSVAFKPHPRILAVVQGDWTGWSSMQQLTVTITGVAPQIRRLSFNDVFSFHAGVQGIITRFLLARLGVAYDPQANPDATQRRENEDGNKVTINCGLGVHFWKLFLDGAFEALLPTGSRTVAQGADNEGGRYKATIYTAELAAQIRF